jgi:hypothetical protein
MKTTVEISDPLFEQARALAAKQGLHFRALVEEGLRIVIETRTRAEVKPFRLRDGSFQGRHGLQPGVDWTDLTTLAYQDGTTRR